MPCKVFLYTLLVAIRAIRAESFRDSGILNPSLRKLVKIFDWSGFKFSWTCSPGQFPPYALEQVVAKKILPTYLRVGSGGTWVSKKPPCGRLRSIGIKAACWVFCLSQIILLYVIPRWVVGGTGRSGRTLPPPSSPPPLHLPPHTLHHSFDGCMDSLVSS